MHRNPARNDKKPSLSLYLNEAGQCRWKDHAGFGQGSIVDARIAFCGMALAEAMRGNGAAPRRPRIVQPVTPAARPESPFPFPDCDRIQRFMEYAVNNALSGGADTWLKARGISREVVEGGRVVSGHHSLIGGKFPCLGFVTRATIPEWKRPIENAWAIFVQDPDQTYRGVKLHFEQLAKGAPKCLWLPFGTQPAEKPVHSYATLWPCPEWQIGDGWLYLTGGELKTASIISAGKMATSITTGESSFHWTAKQIQRLAGRRVCICFDDDPTGHKFRDTTLAALRSAALELKTWTFGREETA